MGESKRMRMVDRKSFLSLLLVFSLLFSLLSTALAKPAEAKSTRAAIVIKITGSVSVKKAGGSKSYTAYADMSLNQGDVIITGASSSAVLKIADHEDEITISDNAEVSIAELAELNGGKQSKIKSWAGSMWVKVKSLVGSEDEFEVETPTAVMGVRGTQLSTYVDPITGETQVFLASGSIAASTTTNGDNGTQENSTFLAPSQQLSLGGRDEVQDLGLKVSFVDIIKLIENASPDVIEAIIRSKSDIDKENQQFIEKMKQELSGNNPAESNSQLAINDMETLDKVSNNFDNIIGNIAKAALAQNKISSEAMNRIIAEMNTNIADPAKKLDLDKVQPLDPTAGTNPELEKLKQVELDKLSAEAKAKLALQARIEQELLERFKTIIEAIEKENKRVQDENNKAQEAAKAKAEAEYVSKLSEAEKQRFNQNKENNNKTGTNPTTTTPGSGSTTTGNTGSSGGSGGSNNNTLAAPYITGSPAEVTTGIEELKLRGPFNANIQILNGETVIASLPSNGDQADTVFTKSNITLLAVNGEYNLTARAERNGRLSNAIVIPKITVKLPDIVLEQISKIADTVTLRLSMANFPQSKEFYAVQAHLLYDKSLSYNGSEELTDKPGTVFDDESKSAETLKQISGSTQNELIYAASQFEATGSTSAVNNITVTGTKELVSIPLTFTSTASGSTKVDLVYVKVVNKGGNTVAEFTVPKSINVTR